MRSFGKILVLGAGMVLAVGCGDDKKETPADPTMSAVTFTVNTAGKADGTNELAKVLATENVFLVGDFGGKASLTANCTQTGETGDASGQFAIIADNYFPCWRTHQNSLKMTAGANGAFTLTLNLKRGQTLGFKAVKTMSARCVTSKSCTNANAKDCGECEWSNGPKAYKASGDSDWPTGGCTNAPAETKGLFEIGNVAYVVPTAATGAVTMNVEAWRDYAEDLGTLKSCD